MTGNPKYRRLVVFGRRQGHRLRPQRQALMRDLLPQIGIDLTPDGDPIQPRDLFADGTKEVWLEIGFGAGEHLAWQAARRPDVGFIGCDPFLNGVSTLLDQIAIENLSNVRIFPDDARLLMARLGGGGINRLFLLFPDPWPKRRHHKRRMVTRENVARFADIMADGGEFRFATDHPEYGRASLIKLLDEPRFRWLAERPGDWRERPEDWPETRYEGKAREAGRAPMFLRFERLARSRAQANSV